MDERRIRRALVTMPRSDSEGVPAESRAVARPGSPLARIPLLIRMAVYGASFLALLLVGLPWLAYRLDLYWPAWHIEIGWMRVVGVVLFTCALVFYLRSSYLLVRHGRGAYVEFDPPREFVASGPYRLVRNPVAACAVLMLLGEALALSSTGIFLLFLLASLLAHTQVVLLEEPLLRKRFGRSYADYVQRVPRWIPRIRGRGQA